eukprot:693924-Prymnesium_polylepis.1
MDCFVRLTRRRTTSRRIAAPSRHAAATQTTPMTIVSIGTWQECYRLCGVMPRPRSARQQWRPSLRIVTQVLLHGTC